MGTVGKKRTKDKHLPERMYLRHGAYYYVPRPSDRARIGGAYSKHLGRNMADALKAYADIVAPKSGSIGEIWEAYKKQSPRQLIPETCFGVGSLDFFHLP